MFGQISRAGLLWPSILFVTFWRALASLRRLGRKSQDPKSSKKYRKLVGAAWIWPISI